MAQVSVEMLARFVLVAFLALGKVAGIDNCNTQSGELVFHIFLSELFCVVLVVYVSDSFCMFEFVDCGRLGSHDIG